MAAERRTGSSVRDGALAAAVGLASLALYVRTCAPSVASVFDDSLEFQVVLPGLGIAHPSGYPLYTLLGKLVTVLVPWRDPAGRANLLSALAAALAVGVLFLLARTISGSRPAALVAVAAFAISPVWWSQATIAEVYALHGALAAAFLFFILRWEERIASRHPGADSFLALAALVAGLGLAHHRMMALLLPGTLVFVLWTDRSLLRTPRRWLRPALLGLAPLLLYLYLPLRGKAVSSLDSSFDGTWRGAVDWILARDYSVFLTGNPFGIQRTAADFFTIFLQQSGVLMLLAAAAGVLVSARRGARRTVWLLLCTASQILFAAAYKVQDVEVFLIPACMLLTLWSAIGLAPVLDGVAQQSAIRIRQLGRSPRLGAALSAGVTLLACCILLLDPVRQAIRGFPELDRRDDWVVYDYGQDMLSSIETDGVVIGLLGETTLVRYFRDILKLRSDITLVPADGEAERSAALLGEMALGRPVYLTRDLPGASGNFSLDASGPLIRVSPKSQPGPTPTGFALGNEIVLRGIQSRLVETHAGNLLRVEPEWSAVSPIQEDLKFSLRLVDPQGAVLAAEDRAPVHFAYPTTVWVVGETVHDVYDLRLPMSGVGSGNRLLVILYRASNGEEVGRLLLDAETLALTAQE